MIQPEESDVSRLTDSEFCVLIESEHNVQVTEGEGVEGSPAILSTEVHKTIVDENCQNEHQLIVCFTPTLEALSVECGLIFVNSEEFPWVRTSSARRENYQKPDGFSTPPHLYTDTGEDTRSALDSWKNRYPAPYRYGRGIWEIRDYYVIWEFKVQFLPVDRGKAYNYLLHLCRGDKVNIYQCILCDRDKFYIIKATNGVIISVVLWKWTQAGSRKAVLDTLSFRNNWLKLLIECSSALRARNVTVARDLGSGGFGRVFCARSTNGTEMALKIVLTVSLDSAQKQHLVISEFEKLTLLTKEKVPHVISVVHDSLTLCEVHGNVIGVAYFLRDVGTPVTRENCQDRVFCQRLFYSLMSIHLKNHHHGDARVQNAIICEDKILWIDFLSTLVNFSSPNLKRKDIQTLIKSIFSNAEEVERQIALDVQLALYGTNDDVAEQTAVINRIINIHFA